MRFVELRRHIITNGDEDVGFYPFHMYLKSELSQLKVGIVVNMPHQAQRPL